MNNKNINLNINNDTKSRKTLVIQVYTELKEILTTAPLEPHSKLNEKDIAKQLGVSATPVREAFKMLAKDGLVEFIPYKGVYVKEYSRKEIKDTYECRLALELLALDLCINNVKSEEIDEIIEGMDSANEKGDLKEIIKYNKITHDYIIRNADNEKLVQLIGFIDNQLQHDKQISAMNPTRRRFIYEDHRKILHSLKENKLDAAKKFMKKHILDQSEYMAEVNNNSKI